MQSLVFDQMARGSESFVTLVTLVILCACMDFTVHRHRILPVDKATKLYSPLVVCQGPPQ
jgi:hypothetical protein